MEQKFTLEFNQKELEILSDLVSYHKNDNLDTATLAVLLALDSLFNATLEKITNERYTS